MGGGGKGGGGGGGTSYQTSQIQIPPEVLARYNAVNARAEEVAQTPFQPYTGQFVAPVNYYQQTGIDQLYNSTHNFQPFFDYSSDALQAGMAAATPYWNQAASTLGSGLAAGTQLTGSGINAMSNAVGAASPYNDAARSGLGIASSGFGSALGSAQPFNSMASSGFNSALGAAQPFNTSAANLAMAGTGQVNPNDLNIQGFMSPYNDAVVQRSLGLLNRQQKQEQLGLRDQMIMGGAFGGDRAGVAAANLGLSQDLAYGKLAADLNNQNYAQALGAAQQQQGVYLGAGQANRAALAGGANTLAGLGNNVFNQGLGAAQGQLAVGNQMFNQGLGAAQGQLAVSQGMAGLGNQVYNQGMGLGQGLMGAGAQMFGQGLGAAGQYGAIGQGQFNQGLGAAQQFQNIGQGRSATDLAANQALLGAGTIAQQTQQADLSALYNQFLQQQGYPFQVTQFLANIAQGTGALSGSTTNTVATQPQPYFSDPKLKDDVETIGHTKDGIPIIRFRYKGSPNTQIGLSADDVEKVRPEAVGRSQGYKTVDYDAATKATGGAVTDVSQVTGDPYGLRFHGYANPGPDFSFTSFGDNSPFYLGAKAQGLHTPRDAMKGQGIDPDTAPSMIRDFLKDPSVFERTWGSRSSEGQRLMDMTATLDRPVPPPQGVYDPARSPPPQAPTQPSKAGGGFVGGNSDNMRYGYAVGGMPLDMNQLLMMHQQMYPGSMNPRGIGADFSGGTGPRGMQLTPSKSGSLATAKTPDMRQSSTTGLQQDLNAAGNVAGAVRTAKDLYSTGKDIYAGGKDALMGSAASTNPKTGEVTPATGGLFGKGGEWSPEEGWFGKLGSKGSGIAAAELPPIDDEIAGWSSGAGNGWSWRNGGRVGLAAGGMPYAENSILPEEIYDPDDPSKLATADAPDLLSKGKDSGSKGGGKGLGSSIGSLAGMGIGAFFGPIGMGLGSAAGGLLGGLFNEGGRVGKDEGGALSDEEKRRLIGLGAAEAPFDFTPAPLPDRVAPPDTSLRHERLLPRDQLPSMPEYEWQNRVRPPDTPPGLPVDQRLPVPSIAPRGAGLGAAEPPPAPSVTVPAQAPPSMGGAIAAAGSTPVGMAAATPAVAPASAPTPQPEVPALAPPRNIQLPPGFRSPGGQSRSEMPYDPNTFATYVGSGESDGKNFENPRWPIAAGGPNGPHGFTRNTWAQFARENPNLFQGMSPEQVDAARVDPRLSAQAADWYAKKNAPILEKAGVPLTNGNLYLAHMLDGPNAAAILSQPNLPAVQALVNRGMSPRLATKFIVDNGGSPDMTGAQFARLHADRLDGARGGAGKTALYGGDQKAPGAPQAPMDPAGGIGLGAASPPSRPGFWDKDGWLDRNGERLATSGLAFIGNMLASPSRTLAGSIGSGLAAAAPMFFEQGVKQTGLEQGQQRIGIAENAQLMSVWAQLKQQIAIAEKNGTPVDPAVRAQVAALEKRLAMGSGAGPGALPLGGGVSSTGRAGNQAAGAAPASGGTPTALPDAPAPAASPAPATTITGASPSTTNSPTATSATRQWFEEPRYGFEDPEFLKQIPPESNPFVLRQRAKNAAAYDTTGAVSSQLNAEADRILNEWRTTGKATGPGGTTISVPGVVETQKWQDNSKLNTAWGQTQTEPAQQRQLARASTQAIAKILESYETGRLEDVKADITALSKAIGVPVDLGNPAAFQTFMKNALDVTLRQAAAGGAPSSVTDALRDQVASTFATPGLQPKANLEILAKTLGVLNWSDQQYHDTTQFLGNYPGADRNRFTAEWLPKNDVNRFIADAKKDIGVLGATPDTRGELDPGQVYVITPEKIVQLQGGNLDEVRKQFGGKKSMKARWVNNGKEVGWEPVK